jgi:hypothetical protein
VASRTPHPYGLNLSDLWLTRGAIVAVVLLQVLFVNDLTVLPRWVIPTLEMSLLVPLSLATVWTVDKARRASTDDHRLGVARWRRTIRRALLALTSLVSLANLLALYGLVRAMLGGHAGNAQTLFLDALNIWATNVIVFALWYWNLDGGGPAFRTHSPDRSDFLFTQQTMPGGNHDFSSTFIDYLFLAFTNATAFSPADTFPLTARAKILMMIEALISLVTIAVVASRAVGILS